MCQIEDTYLPSELTLKVMYDDYCVKHNSISYEKYRQEFPKPIWNFPRLVRMIVRLAHKLNFIESKSIQILLQIHSFQLHVKKTALFAKSQSST